MECRPNANNKSIVQDTLENIIKTIELLWYGLLKQIHYYSLYMNYRYMYGNKAVCYTVGLTRPRQGIDLMVGGIGLLSWGQEIKM